MTNYVLDTFALFAYFQGEKSGVPVRQLLENCPTTGDLISVSLISAGELYYILKRKQGLIPAEQSWNDLHRLPVMLKLATEARILAAARIKADYALSYADAFCVALAQELASQVVTGDPEFKTVESIVPVMWL
ncbi:MAG TPA: type II toxin-antitoxin system VapC family toxin [Anaerolineae bacterium]